MPYLFSSMHNLSEKVDIGGVYLWQEGMPILNKEVEQLLLTATFFLELTYIDIDRLGLVGVHLKPIVIFIIIIGVGWPIYIIISRILRDKAFGSDIKLWSQ